MRKLFSRAGWHCVHRLIGFAYKGLRSPHRRARPRELHVATHSKFTVRALPVVSIIHGHSETSAPCFLPGGQFHGDVKTFSQSRSSRNKIGRTQAAIRSGARQDLRSQRGSAWAKSMTANIRSSQEYRMVRIRPDNLALDEIQNCVCRLVGGIP